MGIARVVLSAIAAAAFLVGALGVSPAFAEKRVALVIGNDRYPNLPPERQLLKAVNDAESVGDTLARMGFEVIRGQNLGRQAMVDRLSDLTARVEAGDTAFVFYAGHGVAIGGVNYLVPSDVPRVVDGAEARVRGGSIAEGDIVAELQGKGVRVAVLVIDACRDNPFPRSGGRSIGNTRGLADARPARGVFTLYSAGIGQTALDRLEPNDPNRNSVFTRVFVEQLAKPGLHLSDLAVEVRERVAEIALKAKNTAGREEPHEQTPAYYDQTIGGRIFLAGRAIGVEPAPQATPAPPQPDPAERAWTVTQNTTSQAVLEDFIRQFGATPYGSMARARLEELKRSQVAVAAPRVAPAAPPSPVQPAVGIFPQPLTGVTPLSPERERSLKPKDSFKECADCPEMIVVPAGSFAMGSAASEIDNKPNEGPQHPVFFERQFAVGKFAVTFDEWDACVAGGGCNSHRPGDQGWGRGTRPVISVSWNDAKAYVAWLSRKTGKTYRLLTEAEWEYVARADTRTPFWWGASISTSQANYNGNYTYGGGRKGEYRGRTLPVGSFQPNPWGFYQVHGNVWQWTEDCWDHSYRTASAVGSAWIGGECGYRVVRGGSWFNIPGELRSAARNSYGSADRSQFTVGFRVARTLDAPARSDIPAAIQQAAVAPPAAREDIVIKSRSPFQGAKVASLSPALAAELKLSRDAEGAVVLEVADGSTAQKFEFKRGDIVVSVNNVKVAAAADLDRVAGEDHRSWQITVVRDGLELKVRFNR